MTITASAVQHLCLKNKSLAIPLEQLHKFNHIVKSTLGKNFGLVEQNLEFSMENLQLT